MAVHAGSGRGGSCAFLSAAAMATAHRSTRIAKSCRKRRRPPGVGRACFPMGNMAEQNLYDNPLVARYASREMAALWGNQKKFSTWRRLWVALAEAQAELGLDIRREQIEELQAHVDRIDYDRAADYERRLRHDVMAHVRAYGDQCPKARPIIHLGATSAYVTDNTDLILLRESLDLVARRLAAGIDSLGAFAARHRERACLAFTHLQPAQPTTVGKRACLWCYDLTIDLKEVERRIAELRFLGVKGTTGTQASFLKLFGGDHGKVEELDRRVTQKMGFAQRLPVSGQTYSRKIDSQVLDSLSGVCQSGHKFATDLRLLQSRHEIEEPFEAEQVGSSAMAYKRNPMRAERLCAVARFVMSLQASAAQTAALQWLERSLDDSANRRLTLPQAMLGTDAVLVLYADIVGGLVVYPEVIARSLRDELPFLATENLLMAATSAGGDRQELHERIRRHSQAAAEAMKAGKPNNLLEMLQADAAFANVDFDSVLDPRQFVGRAPEQVDDFLREEVEPVRRRYAGRLPAVAKVEI